GIENLTGAELVQREPDASSFPTGGLRSTDAARGYTVWDPTSPSFIMEIESGKTLYVPSVFISYTGESLGYKAPLLKSIDCLSNAATAVYQYFDESVKSILPTLGWEQEYFVMDANLYEARPDLMLTGRTLFGRKSAKGQELDDHYFGVIPERVQVFMNAFEQEALKLGIPVLTRHNEVAPSQFECAPMFEELNVSNDHNMLVMDVMHKVASKHGLRILMHEKPFFGINGSGKHNNWSMATDTGVNLLSTGDQPGNNLRFITYFVNIIKAVNENADIFRASITGPGNDHRLGANEAPPAIISIFTGTQLGELLDEFEKIGLNPNAQKGNPEMELDIPKIPAAVLDNTDRNRTSPFPFVGNRFEFRAVGSTQNCSLPMMTLNTMVADQLVSFKKSVDEKIAAGAEKEQAIVSVLQEYIKESKKIIFNGDGYSTEWEEEAEKRGLANVKTTPYALDALITDQAKELFERNNVLKVRELVARYDVFQEIYVNKITTEACLVKELALTHIIPAAIDYQTKLIELFKGYTDMSLELASSDIKMQIEEIHSHTHSIRENIKAMDLAMDGLHACTEVSDEAKGLSDKVKPYFDQIREHADSLEILVDDSYWKLPKYRELLFIK
ncbi:MAG: glutamine synthetase III, partial [Flavobacteriales bacterium]|nr:glutamine synthetase III [Flavobacteriales bacterium]